MPATVRFRFLELVRSIGVAGCLPACFLFPPLPLGSCTWNLKRRAAISFLPVGRTPKVSVFVLWLSPFFEWVQVFVKLKLT